jgi:hypothetical protein
VFPPARSAGYDVAVSYLKPFACVLFFASLFALLAVAAAGDEGRPWAGAAGGLVGLYVGLVVGGVTTGGKLLDALYPPRDGSGSGDP